MGPEAAARTPVATAATPSVRERGSRSEVWHARLALHPGRWLLAAALATALLWFSHLPSLLLHAQFYADDGSWYQAAYAHGPLLSLLLPANGYLVLLQRLGASLSLLLPTIAVPTFFNVLALLVEAGGVCYLLSARMAAAIPSLGARLAIAALVIALPNAYDTSGNLTNAQWHLGLIAFLVVFARPSRGTGDRAVDGGILLLSGLTGPYCLMLEPIVAWRWLRARDDRRRRAILALNSACAAVQLVTIAGAVGVRQGWTALDAGVSPLVTALGRQLTLGLLVGAHGLNGLTGSALVDDPVVLGVLAAIPLAACGWAMWRGPSMLRSFCVFAAIELALALATPAVAPPRWPDLGRPADVVTFHPGGIRYFLYPLLAFALSLGWLVVEGVRRELARGRGGRVAAPRLPLAVARAVASGASVLLLVAALDGVTVDWVYPPYLDLHWAAQVQRLQDAPAGTPVVIPLNPPGFTVTLVAR
jgi:hypothetical protein